MNILHKSLLLLLLSNNLVILGCDDDPSSPPSDQEQNCDLNPTLEGCHSIPISPAHSPQCIAVDGELCLLSFEMIDGAPRPNVLTPNEPFEIKSISIFNAGETEIRLINLSSLAQTANIRHLESELNIEQPSGSRTEIIEFGLSDEEIVLIDESCQQGIVPSNRACTFEISLMLQVDEEAPTDAVQRLELSTETYRGARYEWDLPLLVVDPIEGLTLGEVSVEESGEDEALHSGERIRITELELINRSPAPFTRLRGLLSFNRDDINQEGGELEIWSPESVSGILSDLELNCPAAVLPQGGGELIPSRCALSFNQILRISPNLSSDEPLNLQLHLRDEGQAVSQVHDISLDLSPWAAELSALPIELAGDEDRDRRAAPGERINIRQLAVENRSESALSLRGRVSIDSDRIDLSSTSNLSINESSPREDFFESCPALSTCPLDVNLIIDISEEATIGEMIPLALELVDHTGLNHTLEFNLEVVKPEIDFILAELEIHQDTLDQELSAGERGFISYIKLVNDGEADARNLNVRISTESPWITFEDLEELSFSLNTESRDFDERSSICPALSLEPNSYCYRRPEISFFVSEEAPFGALVVFDIEITDELGLIYPLRYSLTLF